MALVCCLASSIRRSESPAKGQCLYGCVRLEVEVVLEKEDINDGKCESVGDLTSMLYLPLHPAGFDSGAFPVDT